MSILHSAQATTASLANSSLDSHISSNLKINLNIHLISLTNIIKIRKLLFVFILLKKLGQKILDSGYKLQSLLSIYNGKSDPQDYKYISKYNPFYQYPLPNQLFDSLNQLNRDYLFSLVKYWISNFLKLPGYDDSFSANVFELTWVKYNQRMANEMTNYQKYYIPFYTKIQYENNKLSNLYY